MSMIETLLQNHPVRKTKKQKEAFRAWFIQEAEKMGYTATAEKAKGYASTNLVVGNPESATVICTAHYDTPPVMFMPNFITPKNILFYILYQVLMVLVLLVLCGGLALLVGALTKAPLVGSLVFALGYFGILVLMMAGPANKSCANDNTSGVAAVMETMARLPESDRAKVAFLLFDNEEKGLLGSAGYAAKHKNVQKYGLVINLDCVGDGEHIFFFSNSRVQALPQYPLLAEAMGAQAGRTLHMDSTKGSFYPSDQANYKLGVGVCACNHHKVLGYYVDKIHTPKDTVCQQANLDFLADGLCAFAAALPDDAAGLPGEAVEKAADPAQVRKQKWQGVLIGLAMLLVGLALLMYYIHTRGEAPTIVLIVGAFLFGIGFTTFLGKLWGKE